jgi:two-component system OmpR family response regulator
MSPEMNILLIEDDAETADHILTALREDGHAPSHIPDGAIGLEQARAGRHDLLIVDRMLPGLDGLSLVQSIRRDGIRTPVLFLSTLDGVDDRVTGLQAGGDDYLTKPFATVELLARVSALGRRPPMAAVETMLSLGGLQMDLVARKVHRDGIEIELLPREWQLLEYFLRNADKVLTRSMLLEHVWNFHFDPRTNVVETHISRLRQKLDKGFAQEMIQTVRGTGYLIRAAS